MGLLNKRHERMLSKSIESPKYFGEEVEMISTGEFSTPMKICGQVTRATRLMDSGMGDVVGHASSVALRYSTLLCMAGHPANNWESKMPKVGWKFNIQNTIDLKTYSYIVVEGAIMKDMVLGLWVFTLSDYKALP